MKKPRLIIPLGDPSGIGPEIVVKAILSKDMKEKAEYIIVGNKKVIQQALGISNISSPLHQLEYKEENQQLELQENSINYISTKFDIQDQYSFGKVLKESGRGAYEYLLLATDLVMKGKGDALVTPPLNKEALKAAGISDIGHTEILGRITNTEHPITMFQLEQMRVFFLSRHMSLMEACKFVKKENIVTCVKESFKGLRDIGVDMKKFAVAGLNPHCGENGLFGREEIDEIIPAIEQLQREGYPVSGPVGADSVFYQGREGKYDGILSLYHDQGHIGTKSIDFYKTIAVTLGMPVLRTSVDHGTGFDIAGKGIANEESMKQAIRVAADYISSRGLSI